LAAGLPLQVWADSNSNQTATPIKHVIVLIGENFDHSFATYQPKHGQSVSNLLSKGIILADGSAGPNAAAAEQFKVNTPLPSTYFISVSASDKTAFSTLPTPELNGAPNHPISLTELEANPTGVQPPFDNTVSDAQPASLEPSVESSALDLLRTGATSAAGTTGLDDRIKNATELQNTVFQLKGPNLPYDSYTGDTVHRLFHMWQQSDCDVANATPANPSGCLDDLYPFVATARDDSGGNSMGFYNMKDGDVPLLEELADKYTLSDNFHQSVMGGTAANHVALGTGDFMFWATFNGLTQPPANIANPNPQSSTSDKYVADKQWTNCSDTSQPGIQPIMSYLNSLPYQPPSKCETGRFYMINNLSPGFLPNGQIDTASITAASKVPPSPLRSIGDELNENGISWAYYGGGYDAAVRVANGSTDPFDQLIANNYWDICNFESYATSIMGDASHGPRTLRTRSISSTTWNRVSCQ
jgi:phospholipase C